MAFLAGVGVVEKTQDCCRCGGKNTHALSVTAEAVGIYIRIMEVCQIALIRATKGMAGCTA
jgi:hypothetical protein